MSVERLPFELPEGDGIAELFRSAANDPGEVAAYAVYWAIVGVWAVFWSLVVRIHYLHGDWIGVLVTGLMAIGPVAAVAASTVWRFTGRRPVVALVSG